MGGVAAPTGALDPTSDYMAASHKRRSVASRAPCSTGQQGPYPSYPLFIPFDRDRPVGHYEDYLTGFLLDPSGPTTWGRPVGLLALPDGSLLFTEEMNGRIFRVSYRPQ